MYFNKKYVIMYFNKKYVIMYFNKKNVYFTLYYQQLTGSSRKHETSPFFYFIIGFG